MPLRADPSAALEWQCSGSFPTLLTYTGMHEATPNAALPPAVGMHWVRDAQRCW